MINFNRILIICLFFGCLVLAPFADKPLDSNSRNIQAALVLSSGGQTEISEPVKPTSIQNKISSQVSGQTKNFREMLEKHFPDWPERIDYQKKQEKFYRSGLTRIPEAKRARIKLKLTAEEQDAFDYFNGENFYSHPQNVKT